MCTLFPQLSVLLFIFSSTSSSSFHTHLTPNCPPTTTFTSLPLAWLGTPEFKNRDDLSLDTRDLCASSHTLPSLPHGGASVLFCPKAALCSMLCSKALLAVRSVLSSTITPGHKRLLIFTLVKNK